LSVSTGITWVLVYRTDKYKRLKAEVEKQSKKRKLYECMMCHLHVFNPSDHCLNCAICFSGEKEGDYYRISWASTEEKNW